MPAGTRRAPLAARPRASQRPPPRPAGARIGRAALVLLIAAVAVAAAGCAPAPATPDNRPIAPAGQTNGALGATVLTSVNGCVVSKQAANALRALFTAATEAKMSLYATGCYRDLAGQVAARTAWCALDACAMAALPGTSNHGWGKAVDFATAGGMTFDAPAYNWLAANAWRFGWSHPRWAEPTGSAPEPWHWEWIGDGGTLYPGRVLGPQ
jgi:hypothetical protein